MAHYEIGTLETGYNVKYWILLNDPYIGRNWQDKFKDVLLAFCPLIPASKSNYFGELIFHLPSLRPCYDALLINSQTYTVHVFFFVEFQDCNKWTDTTISLDAR